MQANKRAIKALFFLVLTSLTIFALEIKFLVPEVRGEFLGHYSNLTWSDKILLLVEDFEGLAKDSASLHKEKFFSYGNIKITPDPAMTDHTSLSAGTCLKVSWSGTEKFGGWGKGIGKNIDLDTLTDHLSFRIYVPERNATNEVLKLIFQEDDNNDGILQAESDDSWAYLVNVKAKNKWQFISVPIRNFNDENKGGDGVLNVNRRGGLHNMIFSFEQTHKYSESFTWYFDFICFTKGKIQD